MGGESCNSIKLLLRLMPFRAPASAQGGGQDWEREGLLLRAACYLLSEQPHGARDSSNTPSSREEMGGVTQAGITPAELKSGIR